MKNKKSKLIRIMKALKNIYPELISLPRKKSHFWVLVATVLSAQCTDVRSEQAKERLRKKYKSAENLSKASKRMIEKEIYSTGCYRNKASNIKGAAGIIVSKYQSKVPSTMKELVALPGIGRKTANIVMSFCFNRNEGIAVDTHVKRLSGRLGLTDNVDPVKIEKDLIAIVPKADWKNINLLFVHYGRDICRSRNPQCAHCKLSQLCSDYYNKNKCMKI